MAEVRRSYVWGSRETTADTTGAPLLEEFPLADEHEAWTAVADVIAMLEALPWKEDDSPGTGLCGIVHDLVEAGDISEATARMMDHRIAHWLPRIRRRGYAWAPGRWRRRLALARRFARESEHSVRVTWLGSDNIVLEIRPGRQ